MGADSAQPDLADIARYYLIVACSLIILVPSAIILWRRSRRPKLDGDGLFALHEWHACFRAVFSFLVHVTLVLPTMFLIIAFVFGGILAAVEGWSFDDGFKYVICNMSGAGPLVTLTPSNALGTAADILISIYVLIFASTILGLAAALGLAVAGMHHAPESYFGLSRTCGLYIPIVIVVLSAATGALLSLSEDWPFSDGFLFMIGSICAIQDPLTDADPVSEVSMFIQIICNVIELCVGGVVIGLISAHPCMTHFVELMEGTIQAEHVFCIGASATADREINALAAVDESAAGAIGDRESDETKLGVSQRALDCVQSELAAEQERHECTVARLKAEMDALHQQQAQHDAGMSAEQDGEIDGVKLSAV